VASVELSPTHSVKFLDYGGEVTRVLEELHADRDRAAPLTMNKMNALRRPLAEIYEIFAADKTDRAVVAKLNGIDQRLARLAQARWQQSLPDAPKVQGGEGTSPAPVEKPAPVATPALADGVEVRQGAANCAEPAWDWDAEAVWFEDNFCQGSPDMCHPNKLGWLSWGWDWWITRFQVTAMNQSHCAKASRILQWENHHGGISGGITTSTPVNTLMAARVIHNEVWTGGNNVKYYTKIARTQTGSRVGMSTFVTYK
jgi:hypothetical protein